MANTGAFNVGNVPPQLLDSLAARARRQTVDRYGLDVSLFDRAQAIVEQERVVLTGRNTGMVYDDLAGWATVHMRYCPHCPGLEPGTACAHKAAVAFADLLARHAPAAIVAHTDSGRPESTGGLVGHGPGYGFTPWVKARRAGNGAQGHCPACGGFLDSGGHCGKCGRL